MSEFSRVEKLLCEELLEFVPRDKLAPKNVIKKLRYKKFLGYARNIAASFLVIVASVAIYISQNSGSDAVLEGGSESGDLLMMERSADMLQDDGDTGELGGYSAENYLFDVTEDETGEVMDGIAYMDGETDDGSNSHSLEDSLNELYNLDYKTRCFVENGVFSNGETTIGVEGFYAFDYLVYYPDNIFVFGQTENTLYVYQTDENLHTVNRVFEFVDGEYSYGYKSDGSIYLAIISTKSAFLKNNLEYSKELPKEFETKEMLVLVRINPEEFEWEVVSIEPLPDPDSATDE